MEFAKNVLETTSSAMDIASPAQLILLTTQRPITVIAIQDFSQTSLVSVLKNVELMRNTTPLLINVLASRVLEELVEDAQSVPLELKLLLMEAVALTVELMKNLPMGNVLASKDLLVTQPRSALTVDTFQMASFSMVSAQFAPRAKLLSMEDHVDALKEKYLRVLSVSVNARMMNFLTQMETVTLVEPTKSSPMDNVSVPLDIP